MIDCYVTWQPSNDPALTGQRETLGVLIKEHVRTIVAAVMDRVLGYDATKAFGTDLVSSRIIKGDIRDENVAAVSVEIIVNNGDIAAFASHDRATECLIRLSNGFDGVLRHYQHLVRGANVDGVRFQLSLPSGHRLGGVYGVYAGRFKCGWGGSVDLAAQPLKELAKFLSN